MSERDWWLLALGAVVGLGSGLVFLLGLGGLFERKGITRRDDD